MSKKDRKPRFGAAVGGRADAHSSSGRAVGSVVSKEEARRLMPPPPPPPPPLAPAPYDPVLAALESLVASRPVLPSQAEYLAPYAQAEAAARAGHAASLPQIADAYVRLRAALETGQQAYNQRAAELQAASAAQGQAGQQQVAALQQQAIRDLQTQGGGQPALGSLTSGAQAQAGANEAALRLQQEQAAQLARQQQQSMQGQFADRRVQADVAEQRARDFAQMSLNQLLQQIGVKRADASMRYSQAAYEAQRAGLNDQLRVAEYKKSQQVDPLEEMERQIKEVTLRQQYDELRRVPQVESYLSTKEQAFPMATEWLRDAFEGNDFDVRKVVQAIRQAKDSKGVVRYNGKRLDAKVLEQWAREAARG